MSSEPYYEDTEQYCNDEYWQKLIDDEGVEAAIIKQKQMRPRAGFYAEKVIGNHLKIKEASRPERQEKREVEHLNISKKQNLKWWIPVVISFVGLALAIYLAFFSKSP